LKPGAQLATVKKKRDPKVAPKEEPEILV